MIDGHIDALLTGTPSRLAFRRLAARVRRDPDLHDRVAAGLRGWPDHVRCAPWSWLRAVIHGHPPDRAWYLARSLEVEHPVLWWWDPLDDDDADASADVFGHFCRIRLSRPGPMLAHLCRHPEQFGGLRALEIGVGGDDAEFARNTLARSSVYAQLEALELGDRGPTAGWSRWLDYPALIETSPDAQVPVALRRLSVRVDGIADALELLDRGPFPALVDLEIACVGWADAALDGIGANARRVLLGLERLELSGVSTTEAASLFASLGPTTFESRLDIVNANGEALAEGDILHRTTRANLRCVTHLDAAASHLRSVRSLRVTPGNLDSVALAFEQHADALSSLEHLQLVLGRMSSYVGPAERVLANLPASIRRLAISDFQRGDPIATALVASGRLSVLEELRLYSVRLSIDALGTLADAPTPALRTLALPLGWMGDAGAQRLAAGQFPRVERLDLKLNEVTDHGLASLLLGFPRLQWLGLNKNLIRGAALDVGEDIAPRLRELNVEGNPLGQAALAPAFVRLCRQLWSLKAGRSALQGEALRALAATADSELVELEAWQSADDDGELRTLCSETVAGLGASLTTGGLRDLDALILGLFDHDIEPWELLATSTLEGSALSDDHLDALAGNEGVTPMLRASLSLPASSS
ncbi:MAG: hypothetical protein K0V04_33570 [Deltaproteobacteria bacterium]|nr:hypothetical protein [Deltaproteobacteria bacterium]